MYQIAVISDTHGILREGVLDYLRSCDIILHAGDINKPEMIEVLQSITPLYVVRGNNGEWAETLPKEERHYLNPGSCGKRRFGLPITMAIIELNDSKVHIKEIDIVT